MVSRNPWFVVIFLLVVGSAGTQAAVIKGKQCSAIQTGINQLPATGGEIRIPAGTYTCHKPIVIDRDNVHLRGEGAGTLLRLADGANAPVLIMGQSMGVPDTKRRRIVVSDLMIDGNRQKQTSECMGGPCSEAFPLRNNGISIRHCFDCRVERVTVHNASSGGLVTELTSRRLTIRDYTSFDNEFDGLAGYETEESLFTGIHLYNNRAAGFSFDIQFNNNVFNDVLIANSGSVGIFIRDSQDNLFSNVQVLNSKQHGIFLAQVDTDATKPAAGNTFTGLVISNTGGYGVVANDASCNNTLLIGAQLMHTQAGCLYEATPGLVANLGTICR
jgi:hypothetical protein